MASVEFVLWPRGVVSGMKLTRDAVTQFVGHINANPGSIPVGETGLGRARGLEGTLTRAWVSDGEVWVEAELD